MKYLLGRQNPDGSFGDPKATDDIRVGENRARNAALFLNCGESHQSKQLQSALKFLARPNRKACRPTYASHCALRRVLGDAPRSGARRLSEKRPRLVDDDDEEDRGTGLYGYGIPTRPDFSNSQYGVLGVWYAALAGLEVPSELLEARGKRRGFSINRLMAAGNTKSFVARPTRR